MIKKVHRSTPKQRGAAYSTSTIYYYCSLRIRTLRRAFNIRYATRYAALFIPSFNTHGEGKTYTLIKGGKTLSKHYPPALCISARDVGRLKSVPSPLFIGSFRRNRVVKVIASITEGSQESLRALVVHYSARYSPLVGLK